MVAVPSRVGCTGMAISTAHMTDLAITALRVAAIAGGGGDQLACPATGVRAVVGQGGSVSESYSDEIPLSPDQMACSGGVEIVERQFKSQRDKIDSIDAEPGARICDVAKATVDGSTLGIKQQSGVP
jgi:hypothetical protein